MGKINSRDKGKRGELEVIKLLQPIIDKAYAKSSIISPKLERNLMQSSKGGYDILGLEWLALEVKRGEILKVDEWWKQCLSQTKEGQLPVLFFRKNRVPWRIRTIGSLLDGRVICFVDISLMAFQEFLYRKILMDLGTEEVNALNKIFI